VELLRVLLDVGIMYLSFVVEYVIVKLSAYHWIFTSVLCLRG